MEGCEGLVSEAHVVELEGIVLIPSMTGSAVLSCLEVGVLKLDLIFSLSAFRFDMLTWPGPLTVLAICLNWALMSATLATVASRSALT